MFIICPRRTDGTVVLEGNDTRLVDFLVELGRSQGVMVLKATLEYARKGLPINLEAFAPPWVVIQPLGERAIQVFDKDTMYKQSCTLKDIHDHGGQHICTVSTTNKGVVLPADAFTSRPPDHIFFNQKYIVSVLVCWLNTGPPLIPVNQDDWYRGFITEGEQITIPSYDPYSPAVLVYAMRAVVLVPKDRIRRALQFERDIADAISNLKRTGSTSDGPEWKFPICLKNFAVEADCGYLLEILDISVTQGSFQIWEEAMGVLCRFKSVDEIGTSRVFASIKEFSFKKVLPLYVPELSMLVNATDPPVVLTLWLRILLRWTMSLPSRSE